MGAALSIFAILTISVFIVRVASVALRLTGLAEESARFQALSAFTGTGFTTSESEMVVNYPVRRRILSLLMIIGNLGFVTVFATVVVSLVNTDGKLSAVVVQLAWILAGLILLWVLMLNKMADRILCAFISKILQSQTVLGRRHYHRLFQISNGISICEHPINAINHAQAVTLDENEVEKLGLKVLAVRRTDGSVASAFSEFKELLIGDVLVLYGLDDGHETIEGLFFNKGDR